MTGYEFQSVSVFQGPLNTTTIKGLEAVMFQSVSVFQGPLNSTPSDPCPGGPELASRANPPRTGPDGEHPSTVENPDPPRQHCDRAACANPCGQPGVREVGAKRGIG